MCIYIYTRCSSWCVHSVLQWVAKSSRSVGLGMHRYRYLILDQYWLQYLGICDISSSLFRYILFFLIHHTLEFIVPLGRDLLPLDKLIFVNFEDFSDPICKCTTYYFVHQYPFSYLFHKNKKIHDRSKVLEHLNSSSFYWNVQFNFSMCSELKHRTNKQLVITKLDLTLNLTI